MKTKRHFVLVLAAVSLCACASIGPKTISRDQFDYGTAIAGSAKEQLLFNIVGLRYADAPLFVNVSSVINQYSLEGQVNVGAGANTSLTGGNTASLGAASRWADRPTITYSPVSGQLFARSLLTPIPPESLFALIQAGWSPSFIMRMTVRSMNGIENEWASPLRRQQADPRFAELLRVWGRLRNARAIGLRRDDGPGKEPGPPRIVVYRTDLGLSDETQADLTFLQESLGLDPDAKEYYLTYGLVPSHKNEIVVLTSSMLEIMNELAWRVEVPAEHVESGRTGTTFNSAGSEAVPLIRVHTAQERPEDGYVAVRVRDQWFYIDDHDMPSKLTFAILQIMLSMTDSGDTARGPVVSITN